MRNRTASVLISLGLVASGCDVISSSQQTGDLKKAVFTASNCGNVVSSLAGCDLTKKLAVGGAMDMIAMRTADNASLQLRADPSDVLEVTAATDTTSVTGVTYTLTGQSNGAAVLTAFDNSGDIDHFTINVQAITQLDYNTVSSGFGTFKLQPDGDIDGFFTLGDTVTSFTFLYLQVDDNSNSMLGRDSFSYQLSTGLAFQPGKDQPHGLEFDLVRPAKGDYTLLVKAKFGSGRFNMQITAN